MLRQNDLLLFHPKLSLEDARGYHIPSSSLRRIPCIEAGTMTSGSKDLSMSKSPRLSPKRNPRCLRIQSTEYGVQRNLEVDSTERKHIRSDPYFLQLDPFCGSSRNSPRSSSVGRKKSRSLTSALKTNDDFTTLLYVIQAKGSNAMVFEFRRTAHPSLTRMY